MTGRSADAELSKAVQDYKEILLRLGEFPEVISFEPTALFADYAQKLERIEKKTGLELADTLLALGAEMYRTLKTIRDGRLYYVSNKIPEIQLRVRDARSDLRKVYLVHARARELADLIRSVPIWNDSANPFFLSEMRTAYRKVSDVERILKNGNGNGHVDFARKRLKQVAVFLSGALCSCRSDDLNVNASLKALQDMQSQRCAPVSSIVCL